MKAPASHTLEYEPIAIAQAKAHPNLALVKYWGKQDEGINIPATSSIGISLGAFTSTTSVEVFPLKDIGREQLSGQGVSDNISYRVRIGEAVQDPGRFSAFFHAVAKCYCGPARHIEASSENNFPTAAGLASSASGFAALSEAVNQALDLRLNKAELSELARIGSGSASRSIYGGFVSLPRGAKAASQTYDSNHWKQLCCVVVQVATSQKAQSSRSAMQICKETSPFFDSWLHDSQELYQRAQQSIIDKDIWSLGPVIRKSYLRMFSTMFSAEPPIIFWKEKSLKAVELASQLRSEGIPVFETMDAGPQVKLITLQEHSQYVVEKFLAEETGWKLFVSSIGGGVQSLSPQNFLPNREPQ